MICRRCHTLEFTEVASVHDIPEGGLRKATANGNDILLAKVHGQVFATERRCPHLQADLSEGTLEGNVLTCPLHRSQFDIRDGHVVRWTDLTGVVLTHATRARPPRPLKCYPSRIDDGRVLVAVDGRNPG